MHSLGTWGTLWGTLLGTWRSVLHCSTFALLQLNHFLILQQTSPSVNLCLLHWYFKTRHQSFQSSILRPGTSRRKKKGPPNIHHCTVISVLPAIDIDLRTAFPKKFAAFTAPIFFWTSWTLLGFRKISYNVSWSWTTNECFWVVVQLFCILLPHSNV